MPNHTGTGTNLGTSAIYFYSSTTATWLLDSDSTQATQDDVVLYPDIYFIVRNQVATATSLTVTGSVVTNQLMIPLSTQTAGRQDNAVAITRPVAVTLKESGLVSSGAFTKTTGSTPGDRLLVFNNKKAKLNKAPAKIYFYKNGAWRLFGSSGNHNSDAIFTPGTGVLIRKAKTTDGASDLWINPAPYTY
ncbi:MAG: TIGR02597 family protein [Chthoniobacteraceae bacterium]